MENKEICRMSAVEMRKVIGLKEISPVEIMDAVLQRIEQVNPKINAYCTIADNAREEARKAEKKLMTDEPLGLFHGVPVSIKDLIFTKGIRTTGGSKIYEKFIPDTDSISVARLKNAGAIIIGKTNTPESGWVAVTNNPLFGATRNPWDLTKTSGGSSGGAASAVAACMGSVALGTDGGGSIRIPSSFCGVFGLKPSFGLVPQWPSFPSLWEGLSVTGPITRTVQDAALLLEIIAGYDNHDMFSVPCEIPKYTQVMNDDLKGTRIAWSSNLGYANVDKEVRQIAEAAVKVFSQFGCEIEPKHPDVVSPAEAFTIQVAVAVHASLGDKLEDWGDNFDPGLKRYVESSIGILADDYVKARMKHLLYWEKMRNFFEKYDLLLTPTVAVPAFDVQYYSPKEINGESIQPLGWMPFTYPFNITGQPAASLPCGFTADGLPVGLQIIGRKYDEVSVLKAAAAFERVRPWINKYPPLD